MPFNPNQDFAQRMRQNDQRFQRIARENAKRQQDQFKATADRWAREARQRALEQQQRQFQVHDYARRQARAPLVVSSPGWGPTARPQPPRGRDASCRRCGSLFRPGLRTCPGCGASPARAPGRTLWTAVLLALLSLIAALAIAAAVHAASPPPHRTGQAAAQPDHLSNAGRVRNDRNR